MTKPSVPARRLCRHKQWEDECAICRETEEVAARSRARMAAVAEDPNIPRDRRRVEDVERRKRDFAELEKAVAERQSEQAIRIVKPLEEPFEVPSAAENAAYQEAFKQVSDFLVATVTPDPIVEQPPASEHIAVTPPRMKLSKIRKTRSCLCGCGVDLTGHAPRKLYASIECAEKVKAQRMIDMYLRTSETSVATADVDTVLAAMRDRMYEARRREKYALDEARNEKALGDALEAAIECYGEMRSFYQDCSLAIPMQQPECDVPVKAE